MNLNELNNKLYEISESLRWKTAILRAKAESLDNVGMTYLAKVLNHTADQIEQDANEIHTSLGQYLGQSLNDAQREASETLKTLLEIATK